MWIPSQAEHLLSQKSADLRMWIAVIRPQKLSVAELVGVASKAAGVPLCRKIPVRQMAQISALLREVAASPEPAELFNAGLLYAMRKAWEANRRGTDALGGRDIHPGVQTAIRLIQNEDVSLPIPELARRAELSASRFSEAFKRDTGLTPVEFRNRQRIERFLRLYGQGKKRTMLSAAFEAGFGSYPQFFRSFERIMGYRPAEYRRQITAAAM
jgi:AraC-like DNA-binding protein